MYRVPYLWHCQGGQRYCPHRAVQALLSNLGKGVTVVKTQNIYQHIALVMLEGGSRSSYAAVVSSVKGVRWGEGLWPTVCTRSPVLRTVLAQLWCSTGAFLALGALCGPLKGQHANDGSQGSVCLIESSFLWNKTQAGVSDT